MKAVRVKTPGHLDGLVMVDEPTPRPGERGVLIRLYAGSLNFRDMRVAMGTYLGPLKETPIPLSDGAGEIVAVGAQVRRVKVGDRVTANCQSHWIGGPFLPEYHATSIGMTIDGTLAEYILVDENAVVKIPDYLSYQEAASLPCAAVSAWSALTFGSPLTPGNTVLVQGAGGVALFGLQISKMFGARVLAITSSEKKAAVLKSLGADAVVNYREVPEWDKAILDLTDGVGVDKIIDIGGGATIARSASCAAFGGEIGSVGSAGGYGGGLTADAIRARSLLLGGIAVGPRLSFEALLGAMGRFEMRPVIDRVFSFDDYKNAYAHLEKGTHVGKVIIEIRP